MARSPLYWRTTWAGRHVPAVNRCTYFVSLVLPRAQFLMYHSSAFAFTNQTDTLTGHTFVYFGGEPF